MKEPQVKMLVCIGPVYQQHFRLHPLHHLYLKAIASESNDTFADETSGTEISEEKIQKLLNFRKAIYSTEGCRNFWM